MKWLVAAFFITNVGLLLLGIYAKDAQILTTPKPMGAARLILMSELNFDERDALRKDRPEAADSPSAEAAGAFEDNFNLLRQPDLVDEPPLPDTSALDGQCELLAAFDDSQLESIMERLHSVDLDPWVAYQVTQTFGPLMVYVTPFNTSREAAVELTVLRREGIDSFIIADGDLQNGISVGVFSSEQNAMTRLVQLEALGYSADTYQYVVEDSEPVINIPAAQASILADEFWVQLLADFPQVNHSQNSCFEVASQGNFQ